MKVALVYDRVNKWGGAERVLLALHRLFPDAPLYTSVYNRKTASWAKDFITNSSFLQNVPHASSSHELYPLLMPIAFEQFDFSLFDLVITVTSEAAKGIITKPGTVHICYCLTPTRYLWSGYEEYFTNPIFKAVSRPAISYLRTWDKVASSRPDAYIAISQEVQKRIADYYHRESSLVYPPLMLESDEATDTKETAGDFFLVVSRLVSYKRVDLAVKACSMLSLPLVVIGTGSEVKRLQALAGPTVTFKGSLTDQELVSYYKRCKALLFPGKEDFGLTMAEAQTFGKPVIAYDGGGAREIVLDGKTGLLFGEQSVAGLKNALMRFETLSFEGRTIKQNAKRFSFGLFKASFMREIEQILAKK